jgi:nucleotide-binding universal stress UspA family protein
MDRIKEDEMTTLALPTTQFKELLFATDFSDESHKALVAAKAIARRFHAEIAAVNVTGSVNPIQVPEATWIYSPQDQKEAAEQMEQLAAELRSEGFKAKGVCPVGLIDEEVLRTAREVGADLVVTGSHGRLAPSRWVYGSTAEDLARKAAIPLLIVGPGVSEHSIGSGWFPSRVLCAATMDDEGEYVVRYTEALATEFGCRWELACDYYDDVGEYLAWDKFRERLERVLPHRGARMSPLRSVLLNKPYPENLAELARAWEADLLVVGHSHRLLKWSLFKSGTIPKLVADASCPIMTVPLSH